MDTPIESIVEDSELPAQQRRQKAEPAKGKRYSPAQRREILAYAK
jgi:hypothetical protein